MDPQGIVGCARCKRFFVPRFRFQSAREQDETIHYCSQTCREPALMGRVVPCTVCQTPFTPTLATHLQQDPDGYHRYFCGPECRSDGQPGTDSAAKPKSSHIHYDGVAFRSDGDPMLPVEKSAMVLPHPPPPAYTSVAPHAGPPKAARPGGKPVRILAVLNQKGGTAKTTTALSVAAGFAELGHRTLLLDLDPQGNVGVSLGVRHARTASHLLSRRTTFPNCVVPARPLLDVVPADEHLAFTELELARGQDKDRAARLSDAMSGVQGYDYVVIDCAPAQSMVNENALVYAGEVLIPVSCDYLALVGVKQVLRTLRRVGDRTGKTVRVAGVLPTFYDMRNALSLESLAYLRKSFGPRLLPPVRINPKLAEAPSKRQTIFEYAPDSEGARDYMRVVEWFRSSPKAGTVGYAA